MEYTVCFSQAFPFSLLMEKRLVLLVQLGGPQQIHVLINLVHKDQLHEVINSSPIRTVKKMCNAYKQSLAAPTKTAAEAILKDHGLHKIIVSFSIVLSRNKFHLNLSKECLLVHSQF